PSGGGGGVQLRQHCRLSLSGSGGGHALQRYLATGGTRRGTAVAHLSRALACLRGSLCQARLWLDPAHLLPDHEGHGRAQSMLRGDAACFWSDVDSRVGGSGGSADTFPVTGDGSMGADQRIHERGILSVGSPEPNAGTGVSIDCGGDGEYRVVRRAGAAHRLAGRDWWNDFVLYFCAGNSAECAGGTDTQGVGNKW